MHAVVLVNIRATSAAFIVDLCRFSDEDGLKKSHSAPLSVTVPRFLCAPVVLWGVFLCPY